MALTEQDLRDLLRERSAGAPGPQGSAEAVVHRARRDKRRDMLVALTGAAVLVASLGLVVRHVTGEPGRQAVVPAGDPTPNPAPTSEDRLVRTVLLDDLRITTDGPSVVRGYVGPDRQIVPAYPSFTVSVTLTNTSTKAWQGTVGVALYGPRSMYFGEPDDLPLLSATDGEGPTSRPSDPLAFHENFASRRIEGLADRRTHLIEPGETVTVTIVMVKPSIGYPHVDIHGWLPVLNPETPGGALYPDGAPYPSVTFG